MACTAKGTCVAPKGRSTKAEIPNSKLQVPKKFQASKFQIRGDVLNCPVRFGLLEFEDSLELGTWTLELPMRRVGASGWYKYRAVGAKRIREEEKIG